VLVVLQLAGGNDGLNTVVPYEDDHYGRNRTTLRLSGGEVLKLGSSLGFHPAMRGFQRLFQEGRLAVLQGVGYPAMQREHNAGMRMWQTAGGTQTGWLGRLADQWADPEDGNIPALFVGRTPQPLTLRTRNLVVPSVTSAQEWASRRTPLTPVEDRRNPLLTFAARGAERAESDAGKLTAVLQRSAPAYPAYPLAQDLRTVAQFIRADIGIRIYGVEQGGVSPGTFDNHSNQAGNHAVLLRELSESVAAFCDDLSKDRLFDRVLLMTYSEFGRTLSENGRHGTGHGAAAPVFLAGGKIKHGLLGAHPNLGDLDADAPKPAIDFRALYRTVLERWLDVPSAAILGGDFPNLDILT
jgi:uncharacterized protein (DUF1501 family)